MKAIYVTLERFLGTTDQTEIVSGLEILIPRWNGKQFNTPKGFNGDGMNCFYARALRTGDVVLVNCNGGYNTLLPNDKILSMGLK